MLLVGKAPFFSTKYSSRSLFVLKSNTRLLQKDRTIKEKSVNSQRKVITCGRSIEMCRTKLLASQTILNNKFSTYFYPKS